MNEEQEPRTVEPDTGLRKLLTYVFIALALALLLGGLGVYLVVRWFDTAS